MNCPCTGNGQGIAPGRQDLFAKGTVILLSGAPTVFSNRSPVFFSYESAFPFRLALTPNGPTAIVARPCIRPPPNIHVGCGQGNLGPSCPDRTSGQEGPAASGNPPYPARFSRLSVWVSASTSSKASFLKSSSSSETSTRIDWSSYLLSTISIKL